MTPPNIVFVLVDDMGWGDLGAFGNPDVHTPHLDALAREGVALTQQYSASAVCAPARAALMTGRYPHRTGAIDTLEGRGLDRLALDEKTIADYLKEAGYATGLIGKWHLGALDNAYHPNRRGFSEFAGFRGGWQDYYEWRLDRNGSYEKADGRYLTDVWTQEATSFIERHKSESFFLHVCYNAPHTPLQVPDADADPFRQKGKFDEAVCRLYGMIARMDEGVGRIREALQKNGLAENTLFLFTSDNGPQFGSEFGPTSLKRFNGNFNGHKGNVYEGGIRVPTLLSWPGGVEGGGRSLSDMVHFTDWLPTFLEASNLSPDEGGLPLDGASVLSVLRGDAQRVPPSRFWQWNRYTPIGDCNSAMRDGNWKLLYPTIREAMQVTPDDLTLDRKLKYEPEKVPDIDRSPFPVPVLPDAPNVPRLFDLNADPYEQTDLSGDNPARVQAMKAGLAAWFADVEADRRRHSVKEAK